MLSPRWRKLWGDIRATKGRMVMMVIAIAAGIVGVGTILTAYTILTREMSKNYLGTNPASALLEMNRVDDFLVESVRHSPGIAGAEASSALMSRIEIRPGEWKPLLLFVVRDFATVRINTFFPQAGSQSPPKGTILLEREALPLVQAKIGDVLRVQTPNGSIRPVSISGSVHDPALVPAWQEQTAYGYITPETLAWLGGDPTLHTLKLVVKNQPYDIKSIEKTVGNVVKDLQKRGYSIREVRIPPPGRHPHQSQLTAVLMLLLVFGLMALVLSAILIATMINGLLANQTKQIGVMKAIGARTSQIASLYLCLVAGIGLIAVAAGLPLGIALGRIFARNVARMLNLTLFSELIPGWLYVVLVLTGILVPVLMALGPIRNNTRITVREAIADCGISRNMFGSRQFDRMLGKISWLEGLTVFALRNTFRRRGRLLFTLGLLAAAGGMFITGLNVKTAWQQGLADAAAKRHYDLEIRLNKPEPVDKISALITKIPGVKKVESWSMEFAAAARPDGLNIVRTYPDGGHGSLTVRANPPNSGMVTPTIVSGRRIRRGDTDAIVLNQMALAFFPNLKVGDPVSLTINGRYATFRVVGLVLENLTPATVYVSPEGFAAVTGQRGQTTCLRVALAGNGELEGRNVTKSIEQVLERGKVSVKVILSESMLGNALNGHIYIFILSLILMSVLMAVVGALGLMSAIGTSVVERTREFGVLRTIGGKSNTILQAVSIEGLFIGLLSWIVAVLLSLPLSVIIGRFIGNLSFRSPLPLTVSPGAIILWLAIIVLGALGASAGPAWKASQMCIRETL